MPLTKPPRRADDPPEVNMAPIREENRDIWARAQRVYDHFKLAWMFWLGFGLLFTWAMIHIVEPLRTVPLLQRQNANIAAKIDTIIIPRLNKLDRDGEQRDQILKVFGKILCAQTSPEDRYKYDINCRRDVPAPDPQP
jgi:hypothetical protein